MFDDKFIKYSTITALMLGTTILCFLTYAIWQELEDRRRCKEATGFYQCLKAANRVEGN